MKIVSATRDCSDYPNIDIDRIKPIVVQGREVETTCTSDGWTVIQSRGQFTWFPIDYFSRKTWVDYRTGFGAPGVKLMFINLFQQLKILVIFSE